MFGQAKPVVLDRYGSRRPRRGVPRWLVLLVLGLGAGAGGVIFVQDRYLPPRLSAADSTRLRQSYEQADGDRRRLQGELDGTRQRLDAALADGRRLTQELGASRASNAQLRELAASLVTALPPDPRGGAVEVRAARFTHEGPDLAYDVVLTRDRGSKPISAVLQLLVSGESARGQETTASLKPVSVSLGPFEGLRGNLPLPEGFKPRQTTIQVLDGPGGRLLGRRVMNVK